MSRSRSAVSCAAIVVQIRAKNGWWTVSAVDDAMAVQVFGGYGYTENFPVARAWREHGWSAVRSMVKRRETNAVMDELWELGARGILVTDISACRL